VAQAVLRVIVRMISHLPNCPIVGPTLLANSPDWLKAAPMRENLLASWRQSGRKQDPCPSLLNHNAKYKRLLPPCCDFANGVRWIVERTFGWLGRCRRLAKDFEALTRTHLAFVQLAMIRLMMRRIARASQTPKLPGPPRS
jgi:hypothetical protein